VLLRLKGMASHREEEGGGVELHRLFSVDSREALHENRSGLRLYGHLRIVVERGAEGRQGKEVREREEFIGPTLSMHDRASNGEVWASLADLSRGYLPSSSLVLGDRRKKIAI